MTANELADHLATEWIKHEKDVGILMKTSAEFLYTQITMLRQQQAEIEALKQIIDANNLSQNIGQFVKPTNEPVAWMHQNPDYAISKHQSLEYNIPLYTHPVKELTDEEIEQVMLEAGYGEVHKFVNPFDFARAILLKAQKK